MTLSALSNSILNLMKRSQQNLFSNYNDKLEILNLTATNTNSLNDSMWIVNERHCLTELSKRTKGK